MARSAFSNRTVLHVALELAPRPERLAAELAGDVGAVALVAVDVPLEHVWKAAVCRGVVGLFLFRTGRARVAPGGAREAPGDTPGGAGKPRSIRKELSGASRGASDGVFFGARRVTGARSDL